MKMAFIIIDVQNVLVETGFQTKSLLEKISYLQNQARSKNIEIIYVQHIENSEAQTSEDWQLSALLNRKPAEKVFQKKYNSIFKETGLKEYLDKQGIEKLYVVCRQNIVWIPLSRLPLNMAISLLFQKVLSQPLMGMTFQQKRLMNFMRTFGRSALQMS